jgi:hypothetical protein
MGHPSAHRPAPVPRRRTRRQTAPRESEGPATRALGAPLLRRPSRRHALALARRSAAGSASSLATAGPHLAARHPPPATATFLWTSPATLCAPRCASLPTHSQRPLMTALTLRAPAACCVRSRALHRLLRMGAARTAIRTLACMRSMEHTAQHTAPAGCGGVRPHSGPLSC